MGWEGENRKRKGKMISGKGIRTQEHRGKKEKDRGEGS